MSKKGKTDFKNTDHSTLLKAAERIHEEFPDVGDRADEILRLLDAYHNSPGVPMELSGEIDLKVDYGELAGFYKKIHTGRKNKGKSLSQKEAEEYLIDILDQILPKLGYGAKGEKKKNMRMFKDYIKGSMGDEGVQAVGMVYALIREGRGRKAIEKLLELVETYHLHQAHNGFREALVPPDHQDLHYTLADKVAASLEKKTGDKPNPDTFRDYPALVPVLVNYGKREYDKIVKEHKPTDQTPKGKGH